MILYGHPFSSYTWKALIPLYEKALPFDFHSLSDESANHYGALTELWPLGKFPVLKDGDTTLIESSIIIEHLDLAYPETPRMIPADPTAALNVRFLDRVFDNHVMGQMQAVVAEYLPFVTAAPDDNRIARAKAALTTVYAWLEANLPESDWTSGDSFGLADCAAAPSLFYADWVHPIPDDHPRLHAYRARLLARPSVARAVEEARPYRHLFPLGAPDRD